MTHRRLLDLTRLENVRAVGERIRARCPACAADDDGDRTGNHLMIFPDGGFCCAVNPRDRAHSGRILAISGSRDGASPRETSRRLGANRDDASVRVIAAAKANLRTILDSYEDRQISLLLRDNPHPFQELFAKCGPIRFLSALYHKEAILWTGNVNDSGQPKHASRWKSLRQWINDSRICCIGPMVAPGIWSPDIFSRSRDNVVGAPYVVFDFDEVDGVKAKTPAEITELFHRSIAIIRWIRADMRWRLAAILHTGNKSLHAWFHSPSIEALDSIKPVVKVLGIDPCMIGNPAQPCRLPWQRHDKSGNISRVLWLQHPQLFNDQERPNPDCRLD